MECVGSISSSQSYFLNIPILISDAMTEPSTSPKKRPTYEQQHEERYLFIPVQFNINWVICTVSSSNITIIRSLGGDMEEKISESWKKKMYVCMKISQKFLEISQKVSQGLEKVLCDLVKMTWNFEKVLCDLFFLFIQSTLTIKGEINMLNHCRPLNKSSLTAQ